MVRKRVAVTGMGCISPLGIGMEKTWAAIIAGKSGIGPITKFDASNYKTRIAAEVNDFDPIEHGIEKKDLKKMDTFIQYALVCTRTALADSGFEINDSNAERVGVYVGAGLGGLPAIEDQKKILMDSGPRRISPFFIPMVIANLAPGYVAIDIGAKGPNFSVVSACATGAHSIGEAIHAIRRGETDVMVAGGVESTVTPLAIAGFNSLRALSTRNDEPQAASRPFEKDRDGFVLGEAGAIMVLEEMEHAKARGAKIYAEIAGYGATCDAYHITAPDPQGDGAARSIKVALRDAGVGPNEVDHVNAHGTSTPFNDYYETLALKSVFGDHAKNLAISGTKSMTGHCLGAAGAIEAAFSVMALHDGVAPPTINYDTPDPDCDLNYVPNVARKGDYKVAISNSFGFGGTNSCLLIKKAEG